MQKDPRLAPYNSNAPVPAPSAELRRALQLADFADAASMSALQAEVTRFAQLLRSASVHQTLITATVRGVVDDSLSQRAVPIRTSEGRNQLLNLAAEWSAEPKR